MTEKQLRTLHAVLDCVIPPDDFPGAAEAGVGDYLTRQLEGDLADKRDFYCSGLDALENESVARFQTGFANLAPDQQTSTLKLIELGDVSTPWPVSPKDFFTLLVNTTAEGYYSNPEQGGNRNAVSWVMTGFETSSDHEPV
ncbi:MAG TPA: gluconate 2-dehydrogenase subunit 3 family protein [Pyrinomonadaceae bacterium]|nr:gluconate 2-dehydrogenase subunit 3 family protein [Pyrinomonadaceae bacterium]